MKRPQKVLQSTTIKPQKMTQLTTPPPLPPIIVDHPLMPGLIADDNEDNNYSAQLPNLITDVDDKSIANIFCFGAFANKTTGVVYNDCTGDFPFMSLDGYVCFFVMYHYKTNVTLATPIPSLDSKSILDAYAKKSNIL
jgi:hypothetical protein